MSGDRSKVRAMWIRCVMAGGLLAGVLIAQPIGAQQSPQQPPMAPDPAARPDRQPQARTPTSSGAAQEGFVPVDQLPPPQDSIPAPRLVATAYAFAWILLIGYLWSIWRRLSRVERELQAVSRQLTTGDRSS
jgi:CcmD family protein